LHFFVTLRDLRVFVVSSSLDVEKIREGIYRVGTPTAGRMEIIANG